MDLNDGQTEAVFVGDFVWETAQLPLCTLWQTGTPSEKLFVVVHCTLGDLLIALAALTLGLVLAGHRGWPFAAVAALMLDFGLGDTVLSEWLNIVVRRSWAYSSPMPVVSPFGLGIGPPLQWIVVPALALYAARRAATREESAAFRSSGKHY